LKKELSDFNNSSDEEIIKNKMKSFKERKEYVLNKIEEIKQNKYRLESILYDTQRWTPPTKEHINLKEFMIEQIKITIEHDCRLLFYDEDLIEIEEQMKSFDIIQYKKDKNNELNSSFIYYKSEYEKEVNRCNESNKWVSDLFKSLDDYCENKKD
jgi:hypothetical protein